MELRGGTSFQHVTDRRHFSGSVSVRYVPASDNGGKLSNFNVYLIIVLHLVRICHCDFGCSSAIGCIF